jgi:hypothetical protein
MQPAQRVHVNLTERPAHVMEFPLVENCSCIKTNSHQEGKQQETVSKSPTQREKP